MPRPRHQGRTYEALTPEPCDTCTCGHAYEQHACGTGACTQRDSYGIPCECPEMETSAVWSDREDELQEWAPA
jgi:hypothetical protein